MTVEGIIVLEDAIIYLDEEKDIDAWRENNDAIDLLISLLPDGERQRFIDSRLNHWQINEHVGESTLVN